MPRQEAERKLEQIKAKQRKRGVIEPLVGRDWPSEMIEHDGRTKLGLETREGPRKRQVIHGVSYGYNGSHYMDPVRNVPLIFPNYHKFVAEKLEKLSAGQKLRWLDLGPGLPEHFMPYFEQIDPDGNAIDLHTLSPEQILPKKKRTDKIKAELKLSHGKVAIKEQAPNPEYEKWKTRLTHHVGLIETYDPENLGKFDVIVSHMGALHYTHEVNRAATLIKTAQILNQGGKAFLHFTGCANSSAPYHARQLEKALGDNFHIDLPPKYNGIIITRLK